MGILFYWSLLFHIYYYMELFMLLYGIIYVKKKKSTLFCFNPYCFVSVHSKFWTDSLKCLCLITHSSVLYSQYLIQYNINQITRMC